MAASIINQLPFLMLISFDGFRNDYLNPRFTPNLYDISARASRGHMESLYVTKTFPNHFSIATGLYEDEHKIINNRANQLYADETGLERHSGSMMYPGTPVPYKGITPAHLKTYDTKRNWTQNVETVIGWMTDAEKPANFVSMYFDDPDNTAHQYGPWGEQTLKALGRVDSAAGYLVKRLRDEGLLDRTNILFVSDHGMAEVKDVIYLNDIMNTTMFELHGSSPNWSVFVKNRTKFAIHQVYKQLMGASKKGRFKVFKRSEIPRSYHYSKTPRIGDLFIIVDENYDLYMQRSAEPKASPVWGNHGWDPKSKDMRPFFMAYGPSFRTNYYHAPTFQNIDLFPLMAYLLDLPINNLPNNGSLSHIADVIDANHFDHDNGALKLTYIMTLGVLFLLFSGLVFTMFASAKKVNYKPDAEFDDLAPGLNIDLGYYLSDEDDKPNDKKARMKREELLSLLNAR